jgi:hypothetical protein
MPMARRKKMDGQIPRSVVHSLLQRGARGAQRVVVVFKDGVPSSVWGYEEYRERIELPKQVKPWEGKDKATSPDPLGAVEGKVLAPLTRENMYE